MRPNYSPSHRDRSKGPRLRIFILAFLFSLIGSTLAIMLYHTFKPDGLVANLTAPKTITLKVPYVFVATFNDATSDVSTDVAIAKLASAEDVNSSDGTTNTNGATNSTSTYQLVAVKDLAPEQKVLSIDGKYYLDYLDIPETLPDNHIYNGALIKEITLEADSPEIDNYPEITKNHILKINQTGVTALTRAMQNKLNQVGDATFFSEKIADFLKDADLTHISNEVSFADNCSNSANMRLCADPRMYAVIEAIGTDIVELTGNHNNDWGTENNTATINKYHENGLKTFGGGLTEANAKEPLTISEKGTNITWLGINHSTSSKANGEGADGDQPGANIYDAADTKARIKAAKRNGDFVIVDIQFAECYCYPDEGAEMPECDAPIAGQEEFFKELVDAGADLVVGTQAHQPQTYELYHGVPIYYGLGNLFFDQTYWPGTERSLVLTHYFYNGHLLQTKLTPTVYDSNYQTRLMTPTESQTFLKRLS